MSKPSPSTLVLETPELVALIGEFLHLWFAGQYGGFKISPTTPLLRLSLVSKTWHRAFVPVVWRDYSLNNMRRVPSHILQRNTVYARSFCSYTCVPEFSLTDASFPRLHYVTMEDNRCPLDQLLLKAVSVIRLDVAFTSFKNIRPLDRAMEIVSSFRSISRLSLQYLDLKTFQQLHMILSCLPHLHSLRLGLLSNTVKVISQPLDISHPLDTHLPLPIKNLEIDPGDNNTPLAGAFFYHFMQCCHELETMVIVSSSSLFDNIPKLIHHSCGKELLPWARQFCPGFKALSVQGEHSLDSCTKYVAQNASIAVSGSDQGEIVHLKISWLCHPFMSWLALDGKTIQVLDVQYHFVDYQDNECSRCLSQLLSSQHLVSLRELRFKRRLCFDAERCRTVFGSQWGCVYLENLSLGDFWWGWKLEDESAIIPKGRPRTTQWKPKNERPIIEENLHELIQQRLQELPKLKNLTLNGIPFLKYHV